MSTSQAVVATGIALLAPILWAALGELVCEQGGTLNVGIEGVMILGALSAVAIFQQSGDAVLSVAMAVGVGAVCAVILSVLYVRLGTDQIVTGIIFSAMALGIAAVLTDEIAAGAQSASLPKLSIPLLSDLPWVGPVLFRQNAMVFGAFLAVPAIWYLVRRSWYGLHLRAVGQKPVVVETAGLRVRRIRYWSLLIACVFAAVGGATLVLSTASTFQPGVIDGRGFIALAVVVLARWNPFGAVLAALLFGVAQAFQFQAQHLPLISEIPYEFILMAPYLVAIAAVAIMPALRYPAAVGIPYQPVGESRE